MDTNEVLTELYSLKQELSEKDSRIESKIDIITERTNQQEAHLNKIDEIISKLTEAVNDQKFIQRTVDQLTNEVNGHSSRLTALENKSGIMALDTWKKILGIIITVIVTSGVNYIIAKIFR